MSTQKSLCLLDRFEPPGCRTTHTALSYPGRFVRLLGPIVRILRRNVDGLWNQLPVCNTITSQLIRNDLPGLSAMRPQ
jgi:hypothetical protein